MSSKTVLKGCLNIIEIILFFSIVISFSLKSDWIKTQICKAYINYSTSSLEGSMSFTFIHFEDQNIIIDDFIAKNEKNDTLLYIPKSSIDINEFNFISGNVKIESITLENPIANFTKLDSSKGYNTDNFNKFFMSEEPTSSFSVEVKKLNLVNGKFHFYNHDQNTQIHEHLLAFSINSSISNLVSRNDTIRLSIDTIHLQTKKRIQLKHFEAKINVNGNNILVGDLVAKTNESIISVPLLQYTSPNDLKVRITESIISSMDIRRLYTGEIGQNNKINISGYIEGPIANLSLKGLSLQPSD